MPDQVFAPRREASVFPYDELISVQQQAVVRMLDLLAAMATSDLKGPHPRSRDTRFAAAVDFERENRVILIDGSRGSGKTAVLVSLIEGLAAAAFGGFRNDRDEAAAKYDARTRGYVELVERREARGRIIPLPILDLQPLPDGANLGALVIGRLLRVAEELGSERRCGERGASPPRRDGEVDRGEREKLERASEQLALSLASWDGTAGARKAHVEPSVYAMELIEEARLGLDLDLTFRGFMDALCKRYERGRFDGCGEPLFVIPVDDADMNPRRIWELLSLARVLYHPRLAFIFTGDSTLFETVLRAELLAGLYAPLRNIHPHWAEGARLEPHGATDLAVQHYDRAIPPHHRCKVGPIAPADRLKIWSEGGGRGSVGHGTTVMLALHHPSGIRLGDQELNMAQLFTLDGKRPGRLAALLPDRLRALQDFVRFVADRSRSGDGTTPATTVARLVHELWRDAVRRSGLSTSEQRELDEVVTLGERGELSIAAASLEIRRGFRSIDVIELHGPASIVLRSPARGRLFWTNAAWREDRGRHEAPLPSALLASLVLAVDVASTRGRAAFLGRAPVPRELDGLFVKTRYEHGRREPLELAWPQPEWMGFVWSERLRDEWENVANGKGFAEIAYDKIHGGCVLAVYVGAVLAAAGILREPLVPELKSDPAKAYAFVIDRISKDLRSALHRDDPVRRWVVDALPVVCAPEYGLGARDASAVYDAIRGAVRYWGENEERWVERVARRRVRVIADALRRAAAARRDPVRDGEADEIASEIDASVSGYPVRQRSADELLQAVLDAVPVVHTDSFTREVPATLLGYARTRRREALLARTPPALQQLLATLIGHVRSDPKKGPRDVLLEVWRWLGRQKASQARVFFDPDHPTQDAFRVERVAAAKLEGALSRVATARALEIERVLKGSDDSSLDPLADTFLRMLWDLSRDLGDDDMPSLGARDVWDGFELEHHVADRSFVTKWPAPPWPALYDWELMDDRWYAAIDQLARRKRPLDQPVVDALAFVFIDACVSLGKRQRTSGSRVAEVTPMPPNEWQELVKLAFTRSSVDHRGPRYEAWQRWLYEGLVLMAAPESGLSPDRAFFLLDALSNHSPVVLPWAERQERRKRAIVAQGHKPAVANAILRAIDDGVPDHPWLKWAR
ncbi:hypothetical protein DB32_007357 [Sandaracinus amylolyticus]|uniref:Uncharacterized protein n=1 Tax=Sandaracinus amylolyticus TaxID=927083 RepID=A0A0F6W8R4_9BACT|nr:hypothetical protein DB32_007357 [Sandaracinus amylolyticus]